MNAFDLSSCRGSTPTVNNEPTRHSGTLQDVPCALIATHMPWVKRQAVSLCRRLPANVERDDLVQAGLIGLAWAATAFRASGVRGADGNDAEAVHDPGDAHDAFVRFAQKRVKGAMLDELRRMDPLSRQQRQRVKQVQATRERLTAEDGTVPPLSALSASSGIDLAEVARLAEWAHPIERAAADAGDGTTPAIEPSTSADSVEAQVDSGTRWRWFQGFVSSLPDVDQRVIDCYLGDGPAAAQLALELNVSVSAVSQRCRSVVDKITRHLATRERGSPTASNARVHLPRVQPAHAARRPAPAPLRVDSLARWG